MLKKLNNKKIVIALYSIGAQAGKTTVAEYIQRKAGDTCAIESFAAPIKDMVEVLLRHAGLSDGYIKTRFQPANKENPIPIKALGENGSPRHLMQTLGSEWGRVHIHNEVWTDIMENKIDAWFKRGASIVVIDDVRFPDELKMLEKYQTHIIRLNGIKDRPAHAHRSEQYTAAFDFDFEIDNSEGCDLDMLYRQVNDILSDIMEYATKHA